VTCWQVPGEFVGVHGELRAASTTSAGCYRGQCDNDNSVDNIAACTLTHCFNSCYYSTWAWFGRSTRWSWLLQNVWNLSAFLDLSLLLSRGSICLTSPLFIHCMPWTWKNRLFCFEAGHGTRWPNLGLVLSVICCSVLVCLCCYRQHCAKRKAPVFKLLRGRFEVFAPQGRHVAPLGVKFDAEEGTPPLCQISPPSVQLKFLLIFDWNVEYNRPTGAYPLRDFHKICRVCTPFQDAFAVIISLDLLKGLRSYGGFKLMVSGFLPNFQHPVAAKPCVGPQKVLVVQERPRGPLSPCQVQGFHKPGKPGIVREFCKPGKVREFEIWSENILWRVTWFATCLSMSWSLHVMCKLN